VFSASNGTPETRKGHAQPICTERTRGGGVVVASISRKMHRWGHIVERHMVGSCPRVTVTGQPARRGDLSGSPSGSESTFTHQYGYGDHALAGPQVWLLCCYLHYTMSSNGASMAGSLVRA
jgi:hypothetical protein